MEPLCLKIRCYERLWWGQNEKAVVGVPLGDRVQKDDDDSRGDRMFLGSVRNILRDVDDFGRDFLEEIPWLRSMALLSQDADGGA